MFQEQQYFAHTLKGYKEHSDIFEDFEVWSKRRFQFAPRLKQEN